ncbi:MAG: ABC transporter ATP-binding protein [Phycisphaerales bacterium]
MASTRASSVGRVGARQGTPPGAPVVACQGLTKVFKDFWLRQRARAVDNLTFEIHPHEIFGLLGPNGSGKSTTIKIILGLLRPTSGRVAVFGLPPTDVGMKRRIGYLPEESYLYPFLDARETLEYYAKLFEIDRRTRERRIDELLDMVGLTAAQFRLVREYSKGMQRRIGIAQALINDPDFLILDEPTTGLDPIGTRQIKDLIIELGRRGKTVLLSSHLLADVEDCVHRMVILYGGRQRAEGRCEDLLVSRNMTSIETDVLDDATIAEVDRVIRARTGGAVIRVSNPRQSLEALFLDIVEKARAERVETSGAQAGGVTASFLRAKPDEGRDVIDRLSREEAPAAAPAATSEPARQAGPDASLIDLLAKDEAPAPPPRPARPVDTSEVDRSVIGSLLDSRGADDARSSADAGNGPPVEPKR